jgi:hypothetical protein
VSAANVSTTVSLAELNYTHTGASTILDVWAPDKPPRALAVGATMVDTGPIGEHDSTFLLISPSTL